MPPTIESINYRVKKSLHLFCLFYRTPKFKFPTVSLLFVYRVDRRSCKSINGSMSIFYAAGNTVKSLSGNGSIRVEFKDEQISTISDMDMDVRYCISMLIL